MQFIFIMLISFSDYYFIVISSWNMSSEIMNFQVKHMNGSCAFSEYHAVQLMSSPLFFSLFSFYCFATQEGMDVKFQYTFLGTQQQNGRVEWKFATLFNRVHAMLNSEIFFVFKEQFMGWSSQHSHHFLKPLTYSYERLKPISKILWEKDEKHPDFSAATPNTKQN